MECAVERSRQKCRGSFVRMAKLSRFTMLFSGMALIAVVVKKRESGFPCYLQYIKFWERFVTNYVVQCCHVRSQREVGER